MAKKAVVQSPRAANKAKRAARREEIMQRWDRRVSRRAEVRAWEASVRQWILDPAKSHTADELIDMMMDERIYPDPLSFEDMVASVEVISDDGWRTVLAVALRVIELKEMPYQDYLQTVEWKRKAQSAKLRWRGQCALDARHEAADAHHRTYERRGRETDEDVIALCRDCHSRFHNRA